MASETDLDGCRRLFSEFARQTTDAPLYTRLAAGIADSDDLRRLLLHAPPEQRLPVLLFACVHSMLIARPTDPLARFYPNLRRDEPAPRGDPLPEFRRFCEEHASTLTELLSTRSTQTNEVGRTALLLPALAALATEAGPLAQVDAGASAGLNLLIPYYDFTYEPGGTIAAGSAVTVRCATRGGFPLPDRHPEIAAAVGVDANPIDVGDPAQARWLEACVWPDQVERFDRLTAAIEIANRVGTDVRRGDAVASIAGLMHEFARHGHPVVTTSWMMNYLTSEQRRRFCANLEQAAGDVDCSWVYLENPALCPELPGIPPPPPEGAKQPTALVIVRWRAGKLTTEHLADCHPHGRWLHWIAGDLGRDPISLPQG